MPPSLYHHSTSLFLLHLTFYLHHHTLLTLLDLLHTLHPHLTYYQSIDTSPPPLLTTLNQQITAVVQLHLPSHQPSPLPSSPSLPSSASSSPHPSPSSPSHKLRRLLRLRKVWTTRAGRLAFRAHRLRYFLSLPHSSVTLPLYVDRCTRYIHSLYRYITGHPHPPTPPSFPTSLALLEDCILGIDELKEWFTAHLAPLRKPSHLQRHWLRYAALTLTTLLTSRVLYKHRASISSHVENTYASLSLFAKDHLIEPVTSIYQSVFSTFQHRSTLSAVSDQLRESEAVLAGMLKDYGEKRHLPPHELVGLAQSGDMSLVMRDYREGIQRPFYSLAFHDLLQQFLIQVQQVKVSGEEAMVTMDQILSANAINFNILATIPAVLLGLGLVWAMRDGVVRLMMRGSDRSSVYEAVRRGMREVETILIQYLYYGSEDQPRYRHTRAMQQWREKEEMRERGEQDEDDEEAEERAEEEEEAAEEAEEHHEDLADADAHPTTSAIDIVSPQYLPSWAHGQILLLLHSLPAVHNLLDRAESVGWGRSLELLCDPSLTPQQKVSHIAHSQLPCDSPRWASADALLCVVVMRVVQIYCMQQMTRSFDFLAQVPPEPLTHSLRSFPVAAVYGCRFIRSSIPLPLWFVLSRNSWSSGSPSTTRCERRGRRGGVRVRGGRAKSGCCCYMGKTERSFEERRVHHLPYPTTSSYPTLPEMHDPSSPISPSVPLYSRQHPALSHSSLLPRHRHDRLSLLLRHVEVDVAQHSHSSIQLPGPVLRLLLRP